MGAAVDVDLGRAARKGGFHRDVHDGQQREGSVSATERERADHRVAVAHDHGAAKRSRRWRRRKEKRIEYSIIRSCYGVFILKRGWGVVGRASRRSSWMLNVARKSLTGTMRPKPPPTLRGCDTCAKTILRHEQRHDHAH